MSPTGQNGIPKWATGCPYTRAPRASFASCQDPLATGCSSLWKKRPEPEAVKSQARLPLGGHLAPNRSFPSNQSGKVWMDNILHQVETMGDHCLFSNYRKIIIRGFLRWCRISSTHSITGTGEVCGSPGNLPFISQEAHAL